MLAGDGMYIQICRNAQFLDSDLCNPHVLLQSDLGRFHQREGSKVCRGRGTQVVIDVLV
jgi:hypothetical protein